jgi:hypothetical protein
MKSIFLNGWKIIQLFSSIKWMKVKFEKVRGGPCEYLTYFWGLHPRSFYFFPNRRSHIDWPITILFEHKTLDMLPFGTLFTIYIHGS